MVTFDPGPVSWDFYGYETPAGNRDVEKWFLELPEEAQDEVIDVLRYLGALPPQQWQRPEFATLGGGLFEFRIKVNEPKLIVRIYGFHWPEGQHNFTMLLGHCKKVKNPTNEIELARKRLTQVTAKKVNIHVFDF